jgi:hypothetical protein
VSELGKILCLSCGRRWDPFTMIEGTELRRVLHPDWYEQLIRCWAFSHVLFVFWWDGSYERVRRGIEPRRLEAAP